MNIILLFLFVFYQFSNAMDEDYGTFKLEYEGPILSNLKNAHIAALRAMNKHPIDHSISTQDRLKFQQVETYRLLLHPQDQNKFIVLGVLDHPIRIFLEQKLLFQDGNIDSIRSSTNFRSSTFQIPPMDRAQYLIVQIFPKGSAMSLPNMWLMSQEQALRQSFWLTFWNQTCMVSILILAFGFGFLSFIYALLKKWEPLYLIFTCISFIFPLCYAMIIFSNPIWPEFPLIFISRIAFLWLSTLLLSLCLTLKPIQLKIFSRSQFYIWLPTLLATFYLISSTNRSELELAFNLTAKYWIIPCTLWILARSTLQLYLLSNPIQRFIRLTLILVCLAILYDFYYFNLGVRPFCWLSPYTVLLLPISIALLIINEYRSLTQKLIHRNNRLISAYRQARDAIQMRNSLIRNLSHELRTPSNALVEIFSTPNQINTPEAILAVIELSYHAESLIAISSIHAKNFEINSYPFHLKQRLEQLAIQLQKISHSKGFSLEYSQESLAFKAVGDMKRIELVFFELFQIVLRQASHRSKIKIHCILKEDLLHWTIYFCALDLGLEQQSGQKFQRNLELNSLFPEETQVAYWTFLGVLEKLGGTHLIKKLTDHDYEVQVKLQIRPILKELLVGQSLKILVVDDLPINRLVLQEILENLGYEVVLAEDGTQAIEKVLNYQPDLIFMDIQMPIMDGIKATRILRDTHQVHTPIFALTAHAERTECLQAGMDDYLTKPIRKDEIQSMIEQWFGESS